MSERAKSLADRFDQANGDLVRMIERMSEPQWKAICAGEKWSVGVTAHHVAGAHETIAGVVQLIATGQPLPNITMEMIDHGNAQHAEQFKNVTREETLALLRGNGAKASAVVRGLSDAQLDRTGKLFGRDMSAQQFVENVLLGHVASHEASIRAALGT
jgi:uncharacterized damage-inducible protein DinB